MRAEPGALMFIERAFQQSSEDRRLDRRPIRFCGIDQQRQLIGVQHDCFGAFEQAAVEAEDVLPQLGRKSALVHVGPQAPHHRREGLRPASQSAQQVAEAVLWQKSDIFREHCE